MNRQQQLALLDLFIREAQRRATTGRFDSDVLANFVQVMRDTGHYLLLIGPGDPRENFDLSAQELVAGE